MAQTTLSVRLDSDDKRKFEEFCSMTGMNVSVAINMFVKTVLRESKLPFEVIADPFKQGLEKQLQTLTQEKGKSTVNDSVEIAQCGSHYRDK